MNQSLPICKKLREPIPFAPDHDGNCTECSRFKSLSEFDWCEPCHEALQPLAMPTLDELRIIHADWLAERKLRRRVETDLLRTMELEQRRAAR
jgi:hypothetical protein